MEEYELTTVTYGTTSAPYLAVRTLIQIAEDEKTRYPQMERIIKKDFYMDDLLTGADTKEERIIIKRDIYFYSRRSINILVNNFNVRKK